MKKLELLSEYIEWTNSYKKEGTKNNRRESFLAGGIIVIEELLYKYFKVNKSFFKD